MWHIQGANINICRVLVGEPEGKREFCRPRRRWKGKTNIDLKEIRSESVELINPTRNMDKRTDIPETAIIFRFHKCGECPE